MQFWIVPGAAPWTAAGSCRFLPASLLAGETEGDFSAHTAAPVRVSLVESNPSERPKAVNCLRKSGSKLRAVRCHSDDFHDAVGLL